MRSSLAESHRLVSVPGSGRPGASLLILGEAPGKDEVPAGKPFVGEAGKRLWSLVFDVLGVTRDEVYVTNAVKVRPVDAKGKDRRPSKQEIDSWRGALFEEIVSCRPRVILALGVTALKALELPPRVSAARNQPLVWQGEAQVVATYHPGYLLRWPAMEEAFREDLRRVGPLD